MTDERARRREWLFRYEDSAMADDYEAAGLAFLGAMSEIAEDALASRDPLKYLDQFAEIAEAFPAMRAWWTPVPGPAFEFDVEGVGDGHRLLDLLVDYTRYLEGRGLLTEYRVDAGGLMVADEDGDWVDAGGQAAWEYGGGSR